ncbi:MAG TPA: phosphoenolpyruvate--protein phosphotransferase [Burkholderiaceae bacterium]|nr:phosphoenolpyruvate--protein phosphotransferase [Burkholderiaceae bacterium]
MSIQVFGVPVSRGVAIGRAVLVASSRVDVAHYYIAPSGTEAEIDRLRKARDAVAEELSTLQRELPPDAPSEIGALLDVHLMLLHDESLTGATKAWIRDRHYNAEWALSAQLEVLARQFDEMEDVYLRERKADLEQVVERLLKALTRSEPGNGAVPMPRDFAGEDPLVLVASDIAPADMLHFKSSVFTGFVTDVGGRTSHTAIVARSMDIPAVVGAREASRLIRQDDWVIIDGDAGVAVVNPSPIVLEEYRFRQRQSELERARLNRLRHTPAVTLDGEPVELLANIELPEDAPAALAAGAVGVGLFRSEFLFMNRGGDLPDEDEQFEAYREVTAAMKGRPVVLRTLDLGADKALNGSGESHTMPNPAMGLRAIRFCLAEPQMFLTQLRAILRASHYGKVRVLLPMLAHAHEIDQTLALIAQAKAQLDERGEPYDKEIPIGGMIEIPAAALALPIFMRRLNFLSIGTNDLIQYTLAIDRTDDSVAHLYDPLHPAVLTLVAGTIQTATRGGVPVAVCGEMAGDLQLTRLLLGLGLRNFSMHPSQLLPIKDRILRTNLGEVQTLAQRVLRATDPAKTRELLAQLNA